MFSEKVEESAGRGGCRWSAAGHPLSNRTTAQGVLATDDFPKYGYTLRDDGKYGKFSLTSPAWLVYNCRGRVVYHMVGMLALGMVRVYLRSTNSEVLILGY